MATDENYIYTYAIDENTEVARGEVQSDVEIWRSKTAKVRGQNVRDEGIDSWALSGLRNTYVKRVAGRTLRGLDESGRIMLVASNGPSGTSFGKMTLQDPTVTGWLPALFWPDNNHALSDSGGIPSTFGLMPHTTPQNHLEIPYFNWGDYSGDPVNTKQRWVVYCSAEVFLPRTTGKGYVPGVELALGFYWPDNGLNARYQEIWAPSIRGLGINPTSVAMAASGVDSERRCPTSLSYTVVTKFNPNVDSGWAGSPRTTIVDGVDYGWERMKIGLYYRWLRGVKPLPIDFNYIGIGNVSLFAVNYRR